MTFEEYKQQLAENIEIINHVNDRELPYLHWFLTRNNGKMLSRLVSLLETLRSIDNQTLYMKPHLWVAFISIRHLTEKGKHLATYHGTWQSTIIQLLALGLIYRHKPKNDDTDNRYMADSLKKAQGRQPIGYMGVPAYTGIRLRKANRMARKLKESKVSTSKISKADVIQIWGQKVANTIYQDTRTETDIQAEVSEALVQTARRLIARKGYATKQELLQVTTDHLDTLHPEELEKKERFFTLLFALDPGHRDITFVDYAWEVTRLYKSRGRGILHAGGIVYHSPTRQQAEAYNLNDRQWIFTLV